MTRRVNEDGLNQRREQNNSKDEDGSNVSDGFQVPDLGADLDAPPAYGDHFDELQLSQAGFEAGAAVTGNSTCVSSIHSLLTFPR
jgi:hypothetical protein